MTKYLVEWSSYSGRLGMGVRVNFERVTLRHPDYKSPLARNRDASFLFAISASVSIRWKARFMETNTAFQMFTEQERRWETTANKHFHALLLQQSSRWQAKRHKTISWRRQSERHRNLKQTGAMPRFASISSPLKPTCSTEQNIRDKQQHLEDGEAPPVKLENEAISLICLAMM